MFYFCWMFIPFIHSLCDSESFMKNILPKQCMDLLFFKDSLVQGLLFHYSYYYKKFSVVMLKWWVSMKNRAVSMSCTLKENEGSDKVMKIKPRLTGNLTERNQIHETYPCPLLGHTQKIQIINHWYNLFISKIMCSVNIEMYLAICNFMLFSVSCFLQFHLL